MNFTDFSTTSYDCQSFRSFLSPLVATCETLKKFVTSIVSVVDSVTLSERGKSFRIEVKMFLKCKDIRGKTTVFKSRFL